MGEVNCAVLAETTILLQYFRNMPDARQPGEVIRPLDEILLLCLLAAQKVSLLLAKASDVGEGLGPRQRLVLGRPPWRKNQTKSSLFLRYWR